jgi:DNA polymerase elongation subunit (family B)
MKKPVVICDIEVYRDYLLVAFRNVTTGNVRNFEMFEGQKLDVDTVRKILSKCTVITFNGINFDMPVLFCALTHQDNAKCKAVCDYIIAGGYKYWQAEQKFNFKISDKIDHIDIIEIAPGKASLKAYGGRLHTKTMADLPIDPSDSISPDQREELRLYCGNDLRVTEELYKFLLPQIALREEMSKTYGIDLRSKSDAQIAEHVLKHEVERITKNKIEKPVVKCHSFRYHKPDFIKFETPLLQNVLKTVLEADFYVVDSGKVMLPKEIADLDICIGQSTYRLGIGGLHSTEEAKYHTANDTLILRDFDVASYYPAIILQQGLYPLAMGKTFIKVYKDIVDKRLAAKASGDKVTADSLKITINGGFGKFGSKYSILYSPNLLIQTTMTGQLALLMLIESVEKHTGGSVVSANTDGIAVLHPDIRTVDVDVEIGRWEETSGFEIEETKYRALHSRDVNNYIALKSPSGYKLKGAYTPPGLQKNPTNEICTEAVVKCLDKQIPIEDTINGCKDIRKFVTVRKVTGGAVKDGEYLGKVIRWYYGRLAFGDIKYKINNHTVPRSEGAEPLMTLSDEFPCDVNLDWYIDEAYKILSEVGYAGEGNRVVFQEESKSTGRKRKKA